MKTDTPIDPIDPYRSPESLEPFRDGSYKPSIFDWVFLSIFVSIVCVIVFFGTCSGFAFLVVMCTKMIPLLQDVGFAMLFFSFFVGIAAAFYSARYVIRQYWINAEINFLENHYADMQRVENANISNPDNVNEGENTPGTSNEFAGPTDGDAS